MHYLVAGSNTSKQFEEQNSHDEDNTYLKQFELFFSK